MSLEFRLIRMAKRDPYMIAAMDHAIHEAVETRQSPPTLVYHNWEPSVSIASGQALSDLNLEECQQKGFNVVRLPTGGKAVVHFPDQEFSYSLFVPLESHFRDIRKVYETYCGRIAEALSSFGLPSTVVDNNDIFVGDRKIGGNAQRVKRETSMQQGVILYENPDAEVMLRLMHPSLYPDTALSQLQNLLTGFTEYSDASQEELRRRMTEMITGGAYTPGDLTPRERERVEELYLHYKDVQPSQSNLVRGLCWLPAPGYRKEVRNIA